MDDGTAPRRRATRWALTALAAALLGLPTASADPGAVVTTAPRAVSVEAVATGAVVDVFATSESPALQVDGQDGKFPTTRRPGWSRRR